MKNFFTQCILALLALPFLAGISIAAETNPNYLRAAINIDHAVEVQKSTIFDASQSYAPNPNREITYEWDFGDGNRNEGVEVLHTYKEPGNYNVSLSINDGVTTSQAELEVFAYKKLILLITDQTENQDRISSIQEFAKKRGVYMEMVESFGSSTEFISEEVLAKKLSEGSRNIKKAREVVIWTKDNAGLSALSRFMRNNVERTPADLSQKDILLITPDVDANKNRIQRQFSQINPRRIFVSKEASLEDLIESQNSSEFIQTLEESGREYVVIDSKSGKVKPWNFMSYFVNILVNNGVPDNTIALLLLLPVIATVVAFMRQVVGVTTFGIYTPSIITLSFLVIGMYAGLLTLATAILIGSLSRPLLRKVRMLYIPKMAIVITAVSLGLLILLIISNYLGLFNSQFLSIAIFPMLILSTLVEKFVSAKSEKSYASASVLMAETLFVAIVAYVVAGGEMDFGIFTIKFELVKNLMLNYPETIFILIVINVLLGKWTGLRILERIRFREVLRHIEE